MRNSSWRKWLTVAIAAAGFLLGVSVAAIVVATQSAECEHMLDRTITLLPPGMRCYGPKDGTRHIPWGPGDSNPFDLVPIVALGGGAGALLFGLTSHRLMRRKSAPEARTET